MARRQMWLILLLKQTVQPSNQAQIPTFNRPVLKQFSNYYYLGKANICLCTPAGTFFNYCNLSNRWRPVDLLTVKWTRVSMNKEAGWTQDPLWTHFGEYKKIVPEGETNHESRVIPSVAQSLHVVRYLGSLFKVLEDKVHTLTCPEGTEEK
jgi:hypothetical protein